MSIIMPAYNAAAHIAEAIASVQAQTCTTWELLVIDDGSTDDTAHIVAKVGQQDARVKYLHQANAKQGRARNNGIAHAQGELIAFLDADDIWLPHKLAVQLAALKRANVELVFSNAYVFRDAYNPAEPAVLLGAGSGRYEGAAAVTRLAGENFIPILTVLATKSAIINGRGFEESNGVQYGEDYHLWLRMLLKGATFLGLEEPLAAYRLSAGSVTAHDNQNFEQLLRGIIELTPSFPQYQRALHRGISRHVLRSGLETLANVNNQAFYDIISHYLGVTGHSHWLPMFKGLRTLGAKKLTLRAAYFIFNYL